MALGMALGKGQGMVLGKGQGMEQEDRFVVVVGELGHLGVLVVLVVLGVHMVLGIP